MCLLFMMLSPLMLTLLSLFLKFLISERPLNEYISHYETLSYDHKHLHASHSRAKRSVTKDHHVYLRFKAHGRDFNIRLRRDLSTFSDKLEVSITVLSLSNSQRNLHSCCIPSGRFTPKAVQSRRTPRTSTRGSCWAIRTVTCSARSSMGCSKGR